MGGQRDAPDVTVAVGSGENRDGRREVSTGDKGEGQLEENRDEQRKDPIGIASPDPDDDVSIGRLRRENVVAPSPSATGIDPVRTPSDPRVASVEASGTEELLPAPSPARSLSPIRSMGLEETKNMFHSPIAGDGNGTVDGGERIETSGENGASADDEASSSESGSSATSDEDYVAIDRGDDGASDDGDGEDSGKGVAKREDDALAEAAESNDYVSVGTHSAASAQAPPDPPIVNLKTSSGKLGWGVGVRFWFSSCE